MARPRIPMMERLLKFFSQEGEGCWEWNGSLCSYGYGKVGIWDGNKTLDAKAHRLVYEEFVGSIPNGMFVLHHCDNPKCVRFDHLYLGTQADNMRDVRKRNRAKGIRGRVHGEKSHLSILTKDQVRQIRARIGSGETVKEIYKDMNLSISIGGVRKIIARKCWKNV